MASDGLSVAPRPRKRVFFGLWPPAEVAAHLASQSRALAKAYPALAGARCLPPDALHMTLAFLGSVADEDLASLITLAGELEVPAFEITLDTLGIWRGPGVVWAGCTQPSVPLLDFANRLKVALGHHGFPVDTREFAPHVSLFRNVRPGAAKPPFPPKMPPIGWVVTRFRLVESTPGVGGSVYTPLWESDALKPGSPESQGITVVGH